MSNASAYYALTQTHFNPVAAIPRYVDEVFDVETEDTDAARPDIRSAAEHLANIRRTLNPSISDLAEAFGVSRQAVYKWIGEEATPSHEKLERIRFLSHASDAFREAGVARASSLLKIKAFEGRSLMDLVAAGQLLPKHVQSLIAEARAMDAAHDRSGLSKSKAAPSDDWRAGISIPGSLE
jgi:transcriptional regulator with XRE-family HTH domain